MQERDLMELVPNPNPKPNPKIEELDLFPDQDMIPDPGIMTQDMTQDQDLTDLNLLVEDEKNQASVINHKHNQEPHTRLPSNALAANAIVVTRTRKP